MLDCNRLSLIELLDMFLLFSKVKNQLKGLASTKIHSYIHFLASTNLTVSTLPPFTCYGFQLFTKVMPLPPPDLTTPSSPAGPAAEPTPPPRARPPAMLDPTTPSLMSEEAYNNLLENHNCSTK